MKKKNVKRLFGSIVIGIAVLIASVGQVGASGIEFSDGADESDEFSTGKDDMTESEAPEEFSPEIEKEEDLSESQNLKLPEEDSMDIRAYWDDFLESDSEVVENASAGRAGGMTTGESGYALIKQFESCRLTAYKAVSTEKYYTIGWGHYGADVYAGMTITQEQADRYLVQDVAGSQAAVNSFLSSNGITIGQAQFDALVSFTYNCGNVWVSTPTFQLKTILKNGYTKYSDAQIRTAFTNWNKSGGQILAGLTRRRNAEADLFLSSKIPDSAPIPQGTQTISDGEYHIISALDTSKAVDVRGASKDNGANVQLYSNLSDGRNTFHVTYLGNGAYKIINSNSGRCLDVDAAGMTAGTNVQQWDYVGADQQQWIIQEAGDGWFNIVSKKNGLYLDISGGNPSNETNIQVWGGNGTAGQKWRFLAWGNSTGQTIRNGNYHIVSALDGSKGLDVSNAVTDNGTNIQLYSNLSDDKQTFRVTYLGDGYYKIENTYTGKGLDMDAAGTKKGTNIQQWDYVGADQQQWVLKDAGDGYYRIISKHNGLCLDVHNGSSADGSNVQGWVWNGGVGQKWKFVENNPFGCLDGVSVAYGKISLQGWAADRDAPNTPIAVHFYAVQGNKKVLLGGTEAGQRRADVSVANPGLNEYHGFSATFNTDLRGEVKIEAYGINAGSTGSNCMLNGSPKTVTIPEDKTRPVISDVEITDISESGYTVRCKVREEGSGVDRVQFPTWFGNENPYEKDGSWVTSQAVRGKLENGKYTYRVKTSDFKNQTGIYNTHIYAWDKYGNQSEPYTIRVTVKKAHTHEYVPSVKKPATCTEPGIMLYMCKEKDDSYEKEIPATGHQHTEVRNEKPATETQDGYTGDVYCKDCNTKLSSGEVIKKTGITAVLTASPSGSAFSGSQVKLTASADGGTGTYTYKFLICDDKGNWYKLQDYGNSNTCTWIPGAAGKKMLYADVKDSAGTVKRAELSYEVKKKVEALTAKLTADPSSGVVSGKTVKLTANANGGTGSYTYKFLVCDDKGNWYKIRDFGSINTCTWIPGVAGKKTLYVDVKDSTGTVKRAALSYEVKNNVQPLTVKFTADPSTGITSGKQVKLTAIGNGGTGSYTYKFLICDDKENWYRIRDFGSSNTCTWTPGALGKKTLYVDVKDSSGVIIRQKLDITVK